MKRLVLVTLLLFANLAYAQVAQEPYPCYQIKPDEYSGDGKINEQFWRRTPVFRLPDATGQQSNRRNVARLVHDEKFLYVSYNFRDLPVLLDEDKLPKVSEKTRDKTKPADFLKLSFSSPENDAAPISFSFAAFKDYSVVSDKALTLAASPKPEFENGSVWTLEMSIPLAALPEFKEGKKLLLKQEFVSVGMSQDIVLEFSAKRPKTLKEKLVWLGGIKQGTQEEAENAIKIAKEHGFNVVVGGIKAIEFARKENIKVYMGIGAGGGPTEMLPEEKELLKTPPQDYQYGGEPVKMKRGKEVFEDGCSGHFSPNGREAARRQVRKYIDEGCDGLAFDYVGYRNYYADFSKPAQEQVLQYGNPSLDKQPASDRFFEDKLIEVYTDISDYARYYAKKQGRQIKLTAHLYPVFMPNPLYGNRLPLDSCGQTVSWFFQPHWDFKKIEVYTKYVVEEQDRFHPGSIGAPFIAISSDPKHQKSAERVRQEIQIIKDSGAEAIHFVMLGDIIKVPEISKVITEELNE